MGKVLCLLPDFVDTLLEDRLKGMEQWFYWIEIKERQILYQNNKYTWICNTENQN